MASQNEASLPSETGLALGPAIARSRERMLFNGAVLVLVLALWSIPRLSFADGGVHIAMAHLLTALLDGSAHTVLARYFELNLQTEPNWFIYPVLALLLQVFEPHTAEKALLTGYVLGLPFAFRYAVTALRPENAPLSWFALPFVFSWPLNLGLYNFIFSLPWLFVALGYALRHRDDLTPKRAAVLALLAVGTYFAHVTSVIVLVLVLGALGGWRLWREGARAWPPVLASAAALLPVLALTAAFALRNAGQEIGYGPDPWYRTKMLLYGNPLLSHTRWEGLFTTPLALLPFAAAGLLLWRRRGGGWTAADGLLLGAAGVTLFSYVIPNNTSGGGLAVQRLQIYPYLLVMLWLAATTDWPALRRATVAVAGVAAAGLLAVNLVYNHLHSRYVAEFETAASYLEPGSTMLLLDFTGWNHSPDGRYDSFRMNFIGHPQSRFVAGRPVVDLNLYQASTPNFPVRYRYWNDPYLHVRGNGAHPEAPPSDEFLMAGTRSDVQVDYALVWGLTPERAAADRASLTLDQLAEGYELLHVSENGWMRIYRRKGR
ncbi:hypothetical protein [Azospirillum sp. TSO22-1]|uniref:hypothetical protein n=1 Tax=Azospirillum sp. TSO22-1 TaxID=716789 RepID=UPI000D606EB8|nr:hypothetical protein [Azospirillum sp. TSO22-1]PWC43466.1 hypothetical protein TSO221_19990 [Azospirillum sp. TSO22-1]